MGAIAGVAWLHYAATDFPVDDPIEVVDAQLIERLRAHPGLHLALSPEHRFQVELELRDDPLNRLVYGTRIDMREQRDERSIHVQFKGSRGAIHADAHNPKAGLVAWLIHATFDVPFTPLPILGLFGVWLLSGARRRARGPDEPGSAPAGLAPPQP